MRCLALSVLLLTVLPLRADDPSRSNSRPETEQIIDFAKLTAEEAASLKGRRYAFRIEIICVKHFSGLALCCCTLDIPELCGSADLPDSQRVKRDSTLVVEGTIRVDRHKDGKPWGLSISATRIR
jgi:hypothetical protein